MFWFPVLFFFLLVGPLALMNDGLRDAFDPTSMSVGKIKKSKKNEKAEAPAAAAKGGEELMSTSPVLSVGTSTSASTLRMASCMLFAV